MEKISLTVWVFYVFPRLDQKGLAGLLEVLRIRERFHNSEVWKQYLLLHADNYRSQSSELRSLLLNGCKKSHMELALGVMMQEKIYVDCGYNPRDIPIMWNPPPHGRQLCGYSCAYERPDPNKETHFTNLWNERTDEQMKISPFYLLAVHLNLNYSVNNPNPEAVFRHGGWNSWHVGGGNHLINSPPYDPFALYTCDESSRVVTSHNKFDPVDDYYEHISANSSHAKHLHKNNSDYYMTCDNKQIEIDATPLSRGCGIYQFVHYPLGNVVEYSHRTEQKQDEAEKNKLIYQYYDSEMREMDEEYIQMHRDAIMLM